jgi:hypothetical protein
MTRGWLYNPVDASTRLESLLFILNPNERDAVSERGNENNLDI